MCFNKSRSPLSREPSKCGGNPVPNQRGETQQPLVKRALTANPVQEAFYGSRASATARAPRLGAVVCPTGSVGRILLLFGFKGGISTPGPQLPFLGHACPPISCALTPSVWAQWIHSTSRERPFPVSKTRETS